jgi:uncharacterized protein YydD (DUF2326 family)
MLEFNHDGLSIIKGSRSEKEGGRVNGVGKSLAAKIVDFCLGGETIPALKKNIPDWIFTLSFFINGEEHIIERTADGKLTALDEEKLKYKELLEWFKEKGPFELPGFNFPSALNPQDRPTITYRSQISRFLRTDDPEDFAKPLSTHADSKKESLAILRNLYMLGADYDRAIKKMINKLEIDSEKNRIEILLRDNVIKKILLDGTTPEITLSSLGDDISKLKDDIANFEIAEDYRKLEAEANDLSSRSREISRQIAVIDYQASNIDEMLKEKPDITRKDLLELYKSISSAFKPEMLGYFEKVEEFHSSLSRNRIARLNEDKNVLLAGKSALSSEYDKVNERKDEISALLNGKRALDEYVALTQRLAILTEEYNRLKAFLDFKNEVKTKLSSLGAEMAQSNKDAHEYVMTKPLSSYDTKFRELARILYPKERAGIDLQINTGTNQKRYDLLVELEAQSSTGVSEAKIVIYDWLLFTMGIHHTMGFLWHDSKLFTNMDDVARAEWYRFAQNASVHLGKQYIISINTEAYNTTIGHLDEASKKVFEESVIADLHGDPDNSGRLLGIKISDMKMS